MVRKIRSGGIFKSSKPNYGERKSEDITYTQWKNRKVLGIYQKIQYDIPTKSEIPEYYRDNAGIFKTWFRVVKIEEAPKNVLGNCVVASSQRLLSEVSKSSMSPYFIINVEEE